MEGEKPEALKPEIAIRCAKAANLLYSLKCVVNRSLESATDNDIKARNAMKKAVADLKMELVKERMKSKSIKFCSLAEFLLQVMIVLLLWILCLMLAFEFQFV
ncbi:hypothetical protein RJ641_029684 [Dillenia turbinata]|uniref:Uncharacterized protein n=1 Tax=Dillenia turbinata TaxID=194707 RepID=A0AAN8W5A3_9MAGN